MAYLTGEDELTGNESLLQPINELTAKDSRESFDRKEKTVSGMNPTTAVEGQRTGRDDTVQVKMIQELLIPGVKNRCESDLATQVMAWVGTEHL